MAIPVSSAMAATEAPPVMEARRWIEGVKFPSDRPLINVSQAAPVSPPPEAMRHAMADMVLQDPQVHLYGPVLGLPELRAEVASKSSRIYQAEISADRVAITAGCNEAFAAVVSAIASPGDEIVLPTPWYFNHAMWLSMAGFRAVPLPTGPDLLPDPLTAKSAITSRTRAISLVTPNNPGGVEYPSELISAFRDLARETGVALILDETYRDFHSRDGAPHDLFRDPSWDDTVIQLYSFSKAYRLTGHRVGALLARPHVLRQIEKFLDTVTICPPQLGQRAALWGMQNLDDWLAAERQEILNRKAAMIDGFPALDGWRLLGAGAYFAYCEHPFQIRSHDLAQKLVHDAGVLLLPGSMFHPIGSDDGNRQLRIAFANIDRDGIEALFARLRSVSA